MQLHRATPELVAAGCTPVIIGNGSHSFVAGFRERTGYRGEVYTDPGLHVYGALGLARTLRSSLNLSTIRRAMEVKRRGFCQESVQGDAWQQGGVFVISSAGEIVYSYRSARAGDHPDLSEVIDVVEAHSGRAPVPLREVRVAR